METTEERLQPKPKAKADSETHPAFRYSNLPTSHLLLLDGKDPRAQRRLGDSFTAWIGAHSPSSPVFALRCSASALAPHLPSGLHFLPN